MKAVDVMTSRVISVGPEETVFQAAQLMLRNNISGLPVVGKAGKLVGIVTEGDFLRRAETGTQRRRPRWLEFLVGPGRLADEYVHASGRKVREVMTAEVHTVSEETPLEEAVRLMERHHVKRLPVMRGNELIGMVSRANLLHALALAQPLPAPAPSDSAIREKLLAELEKQSWAPRAINIVVHHGIVQLSGAITDERERQALIVAAENVPGVRAVRDDLAWIDVTTGVVFYEPADQESARAS